MNEFVTGVAAANPALPAWLAVILHVPAATSVTVLPLTVQMLAVFDVKLTARPELALATSAGAAVPRVWLPGAAKLMACAAGAGAAMVKVRVTVVAGP